MKFDSPIPILRSFDETKAKEFYVDFLGFNIDWEHRFEDNFPLYMQLSKDGCIIHLSEHHGNNIKMQNREFKICLGVLVIWLSQIHLETNSFLMKKRTHNKSFNYNTVTVFSL